MSQVGAKSALTVKQQAIEYDVMPWRRRLPVTRGSGRWHHGWVVLLDDDRHAILERRARSTRLQYDLLRFSGYTLTDWTRPDPQSHYGFGSFLPNEHGLVGDLVEMSDGLFVFRTRPARYIPSVQYVGSVLRSLSWIQESADA